MSKTMKTAKGTELPLIELRGKEYLEVKYRIVWFREERPDWSIETELVMTGPESACVKATVKNETGRVVATAHKIEDRKGFQDFTEKAETGAVGRALALLGYGTASAQELEEGERIVDAPAQPKTPQAPRTTYADFKISFGKYEGLTFQELDANELKRYIVYIQTQAKKKGIDVTGEAKVLVDAVNHWLTEVKTLEGQAVS